MMGAIANAALSVVCAFAYSRRLVQYWQQHHSGGMVAWHLAIIATIVANGLGSILDFPFAWVIAPLCFVCVAFDCFLVAPSPHVASKYTFANRTGFACLIALLTCLIHVPRILALILLSRSPDSTPGPR